MDEHWAESFPELFQESWVGYADCRIRLTTAPVPDELVTRLHLVALTPAAEVVVCRSDRGWRFLPGGTREPAESLAGLAARELMEEAGAVPVSGLRYLAAHAAQSTRPAPYRPHQPHPLGYWSYAAVEVQVPAEPTNPPDGERVVEVLALPPEQAADYLDAHDPVHAGLVRLAAAMGMLDATPR